MTNNMFNVRNHIIKYYYSYLFNFLASYFINRKLFSFLTILTKKIVISWLSSRVVVPGSHSWRRAALASERDGALPARCRRLARRVFLRRRSVGTRRQVGLGCWDCDATSARHNASRDAPLCFTIRDAMCLTYVRTRNVVMTFETFRFFLPAAIRSPIH